MRLAGDAPSITFGKFRLFRERRLLLEGERPVRLGGRALEILIALVDRAGELVPKEELVELVWPGLRVEEGNLRVHVAALRRVLGDGQLGARYLATEPGRGYRFVAPIVSRDSTLELPLEPSAAELLPVAARLIGRDECVRVIESELGEHRLSTLAGPGGIGKTSVALAIARRLAPSFERVTFVDLSPVVDGSRSWSTLAAALGLAGDADPRASVLAALLKRRTLLVLDNCEQIVSDLAELVECLLRETTTVHVLATSREPLRASTERVHRLPPLALPPRSVGLSAAQALTFPAVQLFVERVAARVDGFELSDADAPFVAEICRSVDGLALAIELSAGRVGSLEIAEISALLDVRRQSLAAAPRHQTLRATLDWSHQLLSESERCVLRGLGAFSSWFELESGYAVAAGAMSWPEFADTVAELVSKSLIVTDVSGRVAECRLLETTRAYALERLAEAGEERAVRARHAQLCLQQMTRAASELEPTADASRLLDDVRSALDWSCGANGDAGLACALTVAAVPCWKRLSSTEECRSRVHRVLSSSPELTTLHQRMELQSALGAMLLSTITAETDEIRAALSEALNLAETLRNVDHQLRALWGLWLAAFHVAEHRSAVELAGRFQAVAERALRANDALIGLRMKAVSLSLLGELEEARGLIERMVAEYVPPSDRGEALRFQFLQEIIGRATLTVLAMQQGDWELARRTSDRAVELALEQGHALSLCDVLAQAVVPVALLRGDLDAAERHLRLLLDTAEQHRLDLWHAWGRCFQAMLLIARGELEVGLAVFETALGDLPKTRFVPRHPALLIRFADAQRAAGRIAEGTRSIEQALALVERTSEHWAIPELLRVQGELALASPGEPSERRERALSLFLRAQSSAQGMGALAWELRAALSSARLLCASGRALEAQAVLAPVRARFRGGEGAQDLKQADDLLSELARSLQSGGRIMTWLTGCDGQRIFVQERGAGRPIVFSHGWPLCSDDWRAQLELFAEHGFRAVAHDRRGHGRSGPPASGNDMDAYARDLAAVLEQLDLRDAVLVGHSTGGGEVVRYLRRYGSQRVAKVVLVGSVTPSLLKAPDNPDGVPMEVFDDARMAIDRDRSQYYQLLPKPYFFGSKRTQKGVTDASCEEFWREGMLGDAEAQRECIRAFSETDFSADLAGIDVPTLIIHGDDDVLVPLDATARRAASMIPGARLEIYEGAPHGLAHTHAERFHADVLAFIGP